MGSIQCYLLKYFLLYKKRPILFHFGQKKHHQSWKFWIEIHQIMSDIKDRQIWSAGKAMQSFQSAVTPKILSLLTGQWISWPRRRFRTTLRRQGTRQWQSRYYFFYFFNIICFQMNWEESGLFSFNFGFWSNFVNTELIKCTHIVTKLDKEDLIIVF